MDAAQPQPENNRKRPGAPPTVPAFRKDGQLRVWCASEQRWHSHGVVGPARGDGDGLRSSHCPDPRSGFDRGYFLHEVDGGLPPVPHERTAGWLPFVPLSFYLDVQHVADPYNAVELRTRDREIAQVHPVFARSPVEGEFPPGAPVDAAAVVVVDFPPGCYRKRIAERDDTPVIRARRGRPLGRFG